MSFNHFSIAPTASQPHEETFRGVFRVDTSSQSQLGDSGASQSQSFHCFPVVSQPHGETFRSTFQVGSPSRRFKRKLSRGSDLVHKRKRTVSDSSQASSLMSPPLQ